MAELAIVHFKITIATSVRVSAAVDLGDFELVGLAMPAAWDAASITFWASPYHHDEERRRAELSTTYNPVTDSDGGALAVAAAADKYIAFTQAEKELVGGLMSTKLVSSADQTADRIIAGIVKPRL